MKIKNVVMQAMIVCLLPVSAGAQKNVSIDWYGFVAAQSFINTHESVASADGFLYLYPTDKNPDPVDGHDRAAYTHGSWFGTMARLGFVLKGPEIFGAASRAKAELEFSGHTAPGSILYRHAFIALDWEKSTLTLGQTWHPMNDLFPSTVGIAIGSPFNALNRSPQLRYEYFMGNDKNTKLTAAAIFQAANSSIGPNGKTYNYARRSVMPMLYAGVDFTLGNWKVGGGLEFQRISPSIDFADNNKKYYMNGLSGMVQAQYNKDKLAIKAKTLVGQNMTHLGICSGFGRTTGPDFKYVPFSAWSSWAQVQYGGALKFGLMGGYMENWGADGESLAAIYAVEDGDLNGMWRVSPNVQYTVGNMSLGIEYELTSVNYMDEYQPGVEVTGSHDVCNNRLLFSVMYSF
ncbi:MAG: hypothetical protein IKX55_08100 [Bacteroidaceae bacterium]|nr:hypothetical protein [Bacteroidaceae bacterium]MBR5707512.1 hypothetical protein [Bacteroidaceae bacterium]